MDRRTLLSATLAACIVPGWARAGMRVYEIAVANSPTSVIVQGKEVSGTFPEFMRLVAEHLGCELRFVIVPRVRVLRMFLESGESELMVPATHVQERDAKGQFVPMLRSTIGIVHLRHAAGLPSDRESLLQRPLRLVMARGYSWGDEFESLLHALEAQGKVDMVSDIPRVIERLRNGLADYTLAPPALFFSTVRAGHPHINWSVDDFTCEPLRGLSPAQIGIYMSLHLPEAERQRLREGIAWGLRQGHLLRLYRQYVPAQWLAYVSIEGVEPEPPPLAPAGPKSPAG